MRHYPKKPLLLLVVTTLVLIFFALCIGPTGLDSLLVPIFSAASKWRNVPQQHTSVTPQIAWQILTELRLPRAIGAWLVGALLGLAGAVAQGLFRNPLADPYLLGSASGAGLGVALAMMALQGIHYPFVALFGNLGIIGMAFIGALLAVFLTLVLAQGLQQTLRLLLAGVVVSIVLGALTQLIFLKDPFLLAQAQVFMLGSVAIVNWQGVLFLLVSYVICLVISMISAPILDALKLGGTTAKSLGLPIDSMRFILIMVISLSTAVSVAQAGLIAFVGLIAPHIMRNQLGANSRFLLVASSLMGGLLLLSADTFARWIYTPLELPVGLVTAILGGAYLLFIMGEKRLRNT